MSFRPTGLTRCSRPVAAENGCPNWGSVRRVSRVSPLGEPPSQGYGVIEPTGHVQAIYIMVPGAAFSLHLILLTSRRDLDSIPQRAKANQGQFRR